MYATISSRIAVVLVLLVSLTAGRAQAQDIVVSGVIDGPLPGGVPKAVELYVVNYVADLSAWGVSSANNGNGATGAPEFVFPASRRLLAASSTSHQRAPTSPRFSVSRLIT